MSRLERLSALGKRQPSKTIHQLFLQDAKRAERFSVHASDLLFDFSKTSIDGDVLSSLLSLADSCGVMKKRDQMLSGQKINQTENRPALHTALRRPCSQPLYVDGMDVMDDVTATRRRMEKFSDGIRRGSIKPATADQFTDVVNIGIGGSDLGPEMTTLALANFRDGPTPHFISNIDGAQATECLRPLNPKTTLVIVASKTFTTIETMTNAAYVREWMQTGAGESSIPRQFAAVSSDVMKCVEFGLNAQQVFGFSDWVGGRYSIWGPIGLSLMITMGQDKFRQFLDGAYEMDDHFAHAPPEDNLPLLHGLVGIWHHQVCRYPTRAILPFDYRLRRLPAYLQQLIMESNGKSVTMDGEDLLSDSSPVIWGEVGTNGQHAFFQALHQGTQVIPCEFLVAAMGQAHEPKPHHDLLVANCLAQSEALMTGQGNSDQPEKNRHWSAATNIDLTPHRRCGGNRPSTTLIYPRLTPFTLGQILALYEHSTFVEGAILDINSFDQWGVELGKEKAKSLLSAVEVAQELESVSGSTARLLEFIHTARRQPEF